MTANCATGLLLKLTNTTAALYICAYVIKSKDVQIIQTFLHK